MQPCHRLFFALRPPEAARPYLIEEQHRFGPGHLIRDEHLHLTAAISNDFQVYPTIVERRMLAIGDAVLADRFSIVLDQVAAQSEAVVMCSSEPLRSCTAFQRRLMRMMARGGVANRTGWRPHPHVTLLYRYGWPLLEWADPLSWVATEFILIHSHVGFRQHRELGRWLLREPASQTLH